MQSIPAQPCRSLIKAINQMNYAEITHCSFRALRVTRASVDAKASELLLE